MRYWALGLCLTIAFYAAPAPAVAQDAGRYSMSAVEGGMLRLDRQTGAVSFCSSRDGSWACEPVPDSQMKLQGEIDRLKAENRDLRAKLDTPVLPAEPDGSSAERVPAPSDRDIPLPSDETIDELMTVLEKMVRRFKDMVDNLEERPGIQGEGKQL